MLYNVTVLLFLICKLCYGCHINFSDSMCTEAVLCVYVCVCGGVGGGVIMNCQQYHEQSI